LSAQCVPVTVIPWEITGLNSYFKFCRRNLPSELFVLLHLFSEQSLPALPSPVLRHG
jgi:hypothetical protein